MKITLEKQVRAYESIFLIENTMRVAMHNILVKKIGVDYFKEDIFPTFKYEMFKKDINILQVSKERKGTEKRYNLSLGYNYPKIWYLDYSILLAVLDNFWDSYFSEILIKPKKYKKEILTRLNNISHIRNAIAHNRYISNVDSSDLDSLLKIMNSYINKDYIENFERIALNKFEKISVEVLNLAEEILGLINQKEFVSRKVINDFKSTFSLYISICENKFITELFQDVIDNILEYDKLPWKPGSAKIIGEFLRDNSLKEKISSFIDSIRRII